MDSEIADHFAALLNGSSAELLPGQGRGLSGRIRAVSFL